jgi:hypothetical protein
VETISIYAHAHGIETLKGQGEIARETGKKRKNILRKACYISDSRLVSGSHICGSRPRPGGHCPLYRL